MKTNTYERGTYYFFDCLNWRKVAKVCLFLCVDTLNTLSAVYFYNNKSKTQKSSQKSLTFSSPIV